MIPAVINAALAAPGHWKCPNPAQYWDGKMVNERNLFFSYLPIYFTASKEELLSPVTFQGPLLACARSGPLI